jgi:magnesium chelatase family protein
LGLAPDLEMRVSDASPESTVQVAGRVHAARSRQALRFAGVPGISLNCRMNQAMTRTHVPLNAAVRAMLSVAVRRAGLSARGLDRVLRVARTIADLDDSEGAEIHHVAEALQYRGTI